MASVRFPSSPRQDTVHPPRPLVPPLFSPGALEGQGEEGSEAMEVGAGGSEGDAPRWFFNMKVEGPPPHNYSAPSSPDRCASDRTHIRARAAGRKMEPGRQGHGKGVTFGSQTHRPAGTRDHQARGGAKPLSRYRKLAAIKPTPSPAELREQIDEHTARSIGDSIIFHNIPETSEDSPEQEVVQFCQDYFVGRRTKHVQFSNVHKMEQPFGQNAPITARFSISLPPPPDPPEEPTYQPSPYITEAARRKLPVLKMLKKRKVRVNHRSDLNSTI